MQGRENAITAYISIHATREGCDNVPYFAVTRDEFQSTHPVRGATGMQYEAA